MDKLGTARDRRPQTTEYRTSASLKQGTTMSLYKGIRASDLLPVVLKVLNPDRYTTPDLEQLRTEFKIAKALSGVPWVVQAHELSLLDGSPALVLEDFGGVSLDEHLKGPMEVGQFLRTAVGISSGLAAIHEKNVIHRDIKPQNIIISSTAGAVKITDFGISRIVARGTSISVSPGVIEGSLPYMSPEQTGRMNRSVDFRSDLYSLGATFYEMLTGKMICDAQDSLEWLHCHIARKVIPAHTVVPGVPAAVSEIVQKLLSKLVEDRYQSALGVKHDLEKCLEQWEKFGRIDSIQLAELDYSDRFQLPSKLYGREREVRVLETTFKRVAEGDAPEALLVAGYSGIGKSSLVHELYKPIVRAKGLFVSGKFDQYKRHVPYATLLQAFREVIQQILTESEERLVKWKNSLQDELGAGAGVIVELIPELELVIGKQPPLPALASAESQNRFNLAFRNFIRVFATSERPLVIFLDDMQWVDAGTLRLLEMLLEPAGPKHVLFIMAYRDNEVSSTHPFALAIDKLKKGGAGIETVQLGPLLPEDLNQLLVDALHRRPDEVKGLGQLVLRKTEGNPFFVNEFLKTLYREGLLKFEPSNRTWNWNEAKINAQGITDNVVDLMMVRMRRMQTETQELLKLAACIGNAFDLDTLVVVCGRNRDETAASLDEGIEEGMIIPVSGATRRYRFQHDRIQQAAYSLIDEGQRAKTHFQIGKHMLAGFGEGELDKRIFDVVNQLNQGTKLITDPAEKVRLTKLNYSAGLRAKATTAYAAAARYFSNAALLLKEEAWASDYDFIFRLYLELAESHYLAGELDIAEEEFQKLVVRAKDDLDRGRIYYLMIQLDQVAGRYDRALELALKAFEMFGLPAPASDEEAGAAVSVGFERAKELMAGRKPADLLNAPRMTDPKVRMLASILEASGPPVYMVRPALFPWVTLQLLNHSLEFGNSEPSCYAYGIYAILLAGALGEVDQAYEFSQLAIELNAKLGDVKLKGCMLHLLGDHVNFWKNPIATDLPILERGFRACLEGGDLIYSNYIAFQSIWHLWEKGDPLDHVLEYSRKYLAFAQQSKHRANYLTIRLEQQFIGAWKGTLPEAHSLSDRGFDENDALSAIAEAKYGCGVVYYHIMKMIQSYSFGRNDEAFVAAGQAEKVLGAAFSMPIEVSYWFYRGLTLAALDKNGSEEEKAALLKELREIASKFEKWASKCPENFGAKRDFLLGELFRLEGQEFEALNHYERGIRNAREQGFIQFEALGFELASRLCTLRNVTEAGLAYSSKAATLYSRWGAVAKAQSIEKNLPKAVQDKGKSDSHKTSSTDTATYMHQLDMLSVVKASQSISSEIELPQLLTTLMDVVIEYTGANRGVLLLIEEGRLVVSAEADVDQQKKTRQLELSPSPTGLGAVPVSVVNYVRRTEQRVLSDDAWREGKFPADEYISRHQTRSMLCLPISRHKKLIGALYLENNSISGVFSAERLTMLEHLVSQVAISIENSRLFKASRDAVEARDEFLSIASHELKTPLTALKFQTQMTKRNIARGEATAFAPERMLKLVDQTDRSVVRLTRLVEDMLDISRIATERFTLRLERFDLSEAIKEEVERLAPILEQSKCQSRIEVPSGLFGFWDRHQIEQVVRNLVTNAAKYGAGGCVEVILRIDGECVALSVRDYGRGIAKDDQARIFNRYERAISASEVSGLGLGLYIVRRIVEMHGGSVQVESEPGKGATFIVRLPMETKVQGASILPAQE